MYTVYRGLPTLLAEDTPPRDISNITELVEVGLAGRAAQDAATGDGDQGHPSWLVQQPKGDVACLCNGGELEENSDAINNVS